MIVVEGVASASLAPSAARRVYRPHCRALSWLTDAYDLRTHPVPRATQARQRSHARQRFACRGAERQVKKLINLMPLHASVMLAMQWNMTAPGTFVRPEKRRRRCRSSAGTWRIGRGGCFARASISYQPRCRLVEKASSGGVIYAVGVYKRSSISGTQDIGV